MAPSAQLADPPFYSPSYPYFCSRDGERRELKERASRCSWSSLHGKFSDLRRSFNASANAKAVAASDDCTCAWYVAGQYGVCEAVDRAIAGCEAHCGGRTGVCRAVDASPSLCLEAAPPPPPGAQAACPPGRYAVASEPCGVMHRLQGVGSIANTLKLWVEVAARLGATYAHLPASTCVERNGLGHALDELLELDGRASCGGASLWRAARAGGWRVINVSLVPQGSHLPYSMVPFDLEGVVERARALAPPPPRRGAAATPVVFNLVGCPWRRAWGPRKRRRRPRGR